MDKKKLEQLAIKLRKTCDESGKETDRSKSAEIFHQFGLELKECSSDKLALIKSVGLLNAAIVRKFSDNISQIEDDLSRLCQHVLQEAGAEDKTADLLHEAKKVQPSIDMMRKKTKEALAGMKPKKGTTSDKSLSQLEGNKIENIKEIQLQITEQYKTIMNNLSQRCKNIMGTPPCKFAIAGMGSLARNEITPYSDFEHIILLEDQKNYEKNVEYFLWFSIIFHIIVLNLQETIIPNLHIAFLNDKTSIFGDKGFFDAFTKNGISFDSMQPYACKFPSGRQETTQNKPEKFELIRPVSLMLEYLSSEENAKNGYHLSDILTSSCFVYGDREVYDQFEEGVRSHRNKQISDERKKVAKEYAEEDLDRFSARFSLTNLKPTDKLNIKQLFYRSSTLFISALGKIRNIRFSSCFDIVNNVNNVNNLKEQKKITESTKHKLLYAVAIACEIRLRVYMKRESQDDFVGLQDKVFEDVMEKIGQENIINYIQITYCLQLMIAKLLNMNRSDGYSKLEFLNITICYALQSDLFPAVLSSLTSLLPDESDSSDGEYFDSAYEEQSFDVQLAILENQIENLPVEETDTTTVFSDYLKLSGNVYDDRKFEEALELFRRLLKTPSLEIPNTTRSQDPTALQNNGNARVPLHDIESFSEDQPSTSKEEEKHIQLNELDSKNVEKLGRFAMASIFAADCMAEMNHRTGSKSAATQLIEQAIQILNSLEIDLEVLARFYYASANTLLKLKLYDRARKMYQQLLDKFPAFVDSREDQIEVMQTYSGIGTCYMHVDDYNKAKTNLQKAVAPDMLKVGDELDEEPRIKPAVSEGMTYVNLGKCLMHLGEYDIAMQRLNEGLVRIIQSYKDAEYESDSVEDDGDEEKEKDENNVPGAIPTLDQDEGKDATEKFNQDEGKDATEKFNQDEGKDATQKLNQDEGKDATQKLNQDEGKDATQKLNQEEEKYATQKLNQDEGKDATQKLNQAEEKDATQKLNQDEEKDATQKLNQDEGKDATQKLNQDEGKDATQKLNQDEEKDATQKLNQDEGKDATQKLNQDEGKDATQKLNQDEEKDATQKLNQDEGKDATQKLYQDEGKDATQKLNQDEEKDATQKLNQDEGKVATQKLNQDEEKDATQKLNQDEGKDATQKLNQDEGKDATQKLNQDEGKDATQKLNQDEGKDATQKLNQDEGKDATQKLNQDEGKDATQKLNQDEGKDATQQLNQDERKDATQKLNQDEEKDAIEKLDRDEGKDATQKLHQADEKDTSEKLNQDEGNGTDWIQQEELNETLEELLEYIEEEKSVELASILHEIGVCHEKLNQIPDSLKCFAKSKEIFEHLSKDTNMD